MAKIQLSPVIYSMSGRLGNIVFFTRYGRQYARSYVSPANPDTVLQRKNRELFSIAVKSWQSITVEERLKWNRKAARTGISGYNLYISYFIKKQACERIRDVFSCNLGALNKSFITYPAPVSLRFLSGIRPLSRQSFSGAMSLTHGPPHETLYIN